MSSGVHLHVFQYLPKPSNLFGRIVQNQRFAATDQFAYVFATVQHVAQHARRVVRCRFLSSCNHLVIPIEILAQPLYQRLIAHWMSNHKTAGNKCVNQSARSRRFTIDSHQRAPGYAGRSIDLVDPLCWQQTTRCTRMLQPRDIVAVFEDDPESGGTIGHYGTVVRVAANAFTSPNDRIVRVFVQGREIDIPERDVLPTGRVDDSNPWVNTSCCVQFDPPNDSGEQRGSYRSRAGQFRFVFRVSERPVSTYNLRLPPPTERERNGNLEYNAAAGSILDHAYVLRAIGEITGELALPDHHAIKTNTIEP